MSSVRPKRAIPPQTSRAAQYCGLTVNGCWSEPDAMTFDFYRRDGKVDRFNTADLRATAWWRALPADVARSIEANLYIDPVQGGAQ